MKFHLFVAWSLLIIVLSSCEVIEEYSPYFRPQFDAIPALPQTLDNKLKDYVKENEQQPDYSPLDNSFSFKDYAKVGIEEFLIDLKNGEFDKFNRNDSITECLSSMEKWFQDSAVDRKLYALRMWDSWAVPGSGVLEGHVKYTGHYFECRLAENEMFSGKYCLAVYGLYDVPANPGIPIDTTFGNCFPSSCSDETIALIYRNYFKIINFPPLIKVACHHDPYWRTIDTVCVVVCAVIVAFCTFGTITDYFVRQQKRNNLRLEKEDKVKREQQSFGVQLLLCFSVVSNGEKVLDTKKHPGTIPVLDGIRFFSITWVIIGHTLQGMVYGLDNGAFAKRQLLDNASFMAILNGMYSVDAFFFLSGLLVTYLGLKQMSKENGRLNVPLMYLQRYLRLTPLYAFLILFTSSLIKYLGSGPGYNYISNRDYESCKNDWWANLLYINNFYPLTNGCYQVAWYLANDWQFFLIAPLFLFLLHKSRVVGVIAACSVIVGSIIVNGVLTALYDIQPILINLVQSLSYFYRFALVYFFLTSGDYNYEEKFQTDIYNMPWTRVHVYMIGMLTGYVLYEGRGKVKMNKIIASIGWIVSIACGLALVYSPWVYVKDMKSMPTDMAALYNSLARPAWGLCLAWIVLASCSGYGGVIKSFLDWSVFKPLSRLTYSVYLVHIYVLNWYAFNQEGPFHYLTVNMVFYFLASVVISFACGFVVSVSIEWPFIGICKLLFNRSARPKQVPNEKITSSGSSDGTLATSASEFSKSEAEKRSSFAIPLDEINGNKDEREKTLAYDNAAFMKSAKL